MNPMSIAEVELWRDLPRESSMSGRLDCRGGLCEDGRCRRASCCDGLLNGAEGTSTAAHQICPRLGVAENTCLLLSGQRVRCFSDNSQGQLVRETRYPAA